MTDDLTYYDLLEVSPKASKAVISSAYRTLCQRYHPDKNSGNAAFSEKMTRINVAYSVLSDTTKRQAYDEELSGRIASNQHTDEDDQKSTFHQPRPTSINGPMTNILLIVGLVIVMLPLLFIGLSSEEQQEKKEQAEKYRQEGQEFVSRINQINHTWEFAERLLVGDLVSQNYQKALEEYTKIAEDQTFFSSVKPMQRIAEMHFYGIGLPIDYQMALVWYEKASKNSVDAEPLFMLGIMYAEGLGVEVDPIAAYSYFNKAQASFMGDKLSYNPIVDARKKQYLQGAINFRDAAKLMKLKIEKSMTLEQVISAQKQD